MKLKAAFLAVSVALASVATPAAAQSFRPDQLAPERPRDQVREGRRMPLSEVFQRLRARYGGSQVDVLEDSGAVYVIRWKTGDGRVLDLTVDARSGAVLR